jgi:hypothetical protein
VSAGSCGTWPRPVVAGRGAVPRRVVEAMKEPRGGQPGARRHMEECCGGGERSAGDAAEYHGRDGGGGGFRSDASSSCGDGGEVTRPHSSPQYLSPFSLWRTYPNGKVCLLFFSFLTEEGISYWAYQSNYPDKKIGLVSFSFLTTEEISC